MRETSQGFGYRFWLALIFIYVLSWQVQNQVLLHFDVSWLTHAAGKMLAGGHYINHFLETNPPLILYLYAPLAYLKQSWGLSLIIGIRLYVLLLSALSLSLCYRFLTTVMPAKAGIQVLDQYYWAKSLILILAFIELILPINEFGQREHLTILLTCPYIFLLGLRLETQARVARPLAFLVGFLAGLGFCIKPYFLLPWGLLELYYLSCFTNWRASFRSETFALVLTVLFYLASIWLWHQDYVREIIPLVSQFYYQRYQRSLLKMLTNEESIYTYFVMFFYFIAASSGPYRQLKRLLLITALGFWIVYLAQGMGWYYHALPFIAFELLLSVLLLLPLLSLSRLYTSTWVLSLVFVITFFAYLAIKIPYLSLCANFFPYAYFGYFAAIFIPLLLINHFFRCDRRFFYALGFIFILNAMVYRYLWVTVFYPHLFMLSTLMFILSFGLVVPAKSSLDKLRILLLTLVALFLFVLPAYKMAYTRSSAAYYKMMYSQYTDAMKKFAGKKVLYLSNASEMGFPNMDYSGQIYASRFWSLIWLPVMKFPQNVWSYPAYLEENREALNFYLGALIEDFKQYQPDYVFVDARGKGYYYTLPPDYLQLFALNKDFRQEWRHYHYLETLDSKPLYKLDVYHRV